MGHIVNPISFRLGLNRTWNSAWSSYNHINYAYLIQRDLFIYNFLKLFFNNSLLIAQGFLYSHTRIIALPEGNFKVINYIYNQTFFKFYKVLIPFLNVIIYKVLNIKTLKLNKIKKYIQITKNLEHKDVIVIFINKLYNFLLYYIYNIFFIKPLFYALKLLNIVIKRWLIMVSPAFLNYEFSYIFLNLEQVTPQIVSFYITTKLKRRHILGKILKPIFKNLNDNKLILGYKISCSGRFTRKQRATYLWENNGLIPFNRINAVIDYSYRQISLPFGVCGVKVWLCRKI